MKLTILATLSLLGEPTVGLGDSAEVRARRRERIFPFIQSGDTAALRLVLARRRVSPLDVRAETGEPALMYTLRIGHSKRGEMIPFFSMPVRTTFQENDHGISAIHLVRKRVSGNRGNPEYLQMLRECFPNDMLLDGWQLSDLTRSILGILPIPLSSLLDSQEYRDQVNEPTSDGSTPLHWAAARGDATSVSSLLLAGADINARDEEQTAPLSYSFLSIHSAAAKVLLKAGADRTAPNIYGNEPLHYAGNRAQDDLGPMDDLIRGGALIDCTNKEGYTPLFYAINANKVRSVEFLLDRGPVWKQEISEGILPSPSLS